MKPETRPGHPHLLLTPARAAEVGRRLPEAIASLEATGYADPVLIVDDGSRPARRTWRTCVISRGKDDIR